MKLKNIRSVPAALKEALVRDAVARGQTMSSVAVGILCEFFRLDPPPAGNLKQVPGLGDQIQLRIPDDHPLFPSIWAASRSWHCTESSAVIRILSSHYGVPYTRRARGGARRVS